MARALIELSERMRSSPAEDDALARSLAETGWQVEVRAMLRRRDAGAAVDIVIHLLESVEDHALDALIGAAVGAVVARVKRPRSDAEPDAIVAIFGPTGEELRRVPVPLRGEGGARDDARSEGADTPGST